MSNKIEDARKAVRMAQDAIVDLWTNVPPGQINDVEHRYLEQIDVSLQEMALRVEYLRGARGVEKKRGVV